MAETIATKERTARRPGKGWRWQCWWCWGHLEKGDRYVEDTIKDDDGIGRIRSHPECSAAFDRDGFYGEDDPITEPQPRGRTREEQDEIDNLSEGFRQLPGVAILLANPPDDGP